MLLHVFNKNFMKHLNPHWKNISIVCTVGCLTKNMQLLKHIWIVGFSRVKKGSSLKKQLYFSDQIKLKAAGM